MLDIRTPQDAAICPLISARPPSIVDVESAPTDETLLPQILHFTPRGAAWSTDENFEPETVLRGVWLAIADFAADMWTRLFTVFSQAFPSLVTDALADWETELGLPEAGEEAIYATLDDAARLRAVRQAYADAGGASPGYFICVADQLGYRVEVTENGFFAFDGTPFDGATRLAMLSDVRLFSCDGVMSFDSVTGLTNFCVDPTQFWTVKLLDIQATYLAFDGVMSFDGAQALTSIPYATALERRIRNRANVETYVFFDYSGAAS
ncbi:DUF2313 domain-containing protein [Rhodoblastus acidophilus]|uniref:DUF2313 domain-containing protein n=1 Tax=Rhodoblastus acidophilus TaxID=1074 RepID=A0A6N8DV58_RHOAC|nr:putative phage tail protein [Rhodoblastus acidophilus]MCW2276386.1 hypothetical protein [Rhodoblastus acidophilus]MTV33041.1 DUF2313 domain-containing protein [Rhodoblastus acidophilus]